MPGKTYIDNALHYDSIGSSQIYAASFLHKLVSNFFLEHLKRVKNEKKISDFW